MGLFMRFFVCLFAITGAVTLASTLLGVRFDHFNYWDYHGFLFLVCISCFPRLTLLFSSVASGGWLWWLGWLFSPRLLVALLATLAYWNQNPFLVAAAWLVAFGGESSEKYVVVEKSKTFWKGRKGYDSAKWVDAKVE